MDAGEVSVRVVAKDDNFTAFMTRARREAQALGKTIETLGHGTVSSMQASSAAIRLLEGGMTGKIRAAERFLGRLPGVGAALQAAFPVFGAAAFLGVFAKVGEEIFTASHELNPDRSRRYGEVGRRTLPIRRVRDAILAALPPGEKVYQAQPKKAFAV